MLADHLPNPHAGLEEEADQEEGRDQDQEVVDREVDHYLARVAAEIEAQQQPDDETADAARLGAPDVVPVR